MIGDVVYDVLVCVSYLWTKVVIVEPGAFPDMFVGIDCCSCRDRRVGFVQLRGHERRKGWGEGMFVLTLSDRYSVNSDSTKDTIFLECDNFFLNLPYFIWTGFSFL